MGAEAQGGRLKRLGVRDCKWQPKKSSVLAGAASVYPHEAVQLKKQAHRYTH